MIRMDKKGNNITIVGQFTTINDVVMDIGVNTDGYDMNMYYASTGEIRNPLYSNCYDDLEPLFDAESEWNKIPSYIREMVIWTLKSNRLASIKLVKGYRNEFSGNNNLIEAKKLVEFALG